MLAINLEPELERHLNKQAVRSGQPVEKLVREAIIAMLEELEDTAAAEEALANYDPSTNVSLAQVRRRLGLGD